MKYSIAILTIGFVLRISQGAAHQHGRTVANVAGHHLDGQFGAVEVAQHGVDGMGEVQFAVHQRTVKVPEKQFYLCSRNRSASLNHLKS